MREDIDRTRLVHFLKELGLAYRRPARLYLCGGETLVWRGLRDTTRDVDISFSVDDADHHAWIRAIVALKDRLRVNVEEAQPSDFVPVPRGAEGRAEFVGRFGTVDVFLCDPYSIAMAKLHRGAARDLADIRSLLDADVLASDTLRDLVEDTITNDPRPRIGFDAARVRRNLDAVFET